MPRDAAKRMKVDTGWAIISRDGRIPMEFAERYLTIYNSKRDAVVSVKNGTWNADRIARVEIRELPPKPRKRNAP